MAATFHGHSTLARLPRSSYPNLAAPQQARRGKALQCKGGRAYSGAGMPARLAWQIRSTTDRRHGRARGGGPGLRLPSHHRRALVTGS